MGMLPFLAAGLVGLVFAYQAEDRPSFERDRLSEACTAEDWDACGRLGNDYYFGESGPVDHEQAAQFYRLACESNRQDFCTALGFLLLHDEGALRDLERAATLFLDACDREEPYGCHNLAFVYQEGLGVDQNQGTARMLYRRACSLGLNASCLAASDD